MKAMTMLAPAKLNLFLAVTGRRADGFHELVSVVAPLAWGDELEVEAWNAEGGRSAEGEFSLACDAPDVPRDESNLVLKAAREFCVTTGWRGGARFALKKRIPAGAGLGGGSSDAAAALRALNELAGRPLAPAALAEVAARVGSDCALFLRGGPVAMRGRGERVEALPAAGRLSGRRVLVFKPAFGIATVWSYGRLAAGAPGSYAAAVEAEARLARWLGGKEPAEELLFNNLEGPAFGKFPALPVLLETLRKNFGVAAGMSGSGSACFALLREDSPEDAIVAAMERAWGKSSFHVTTRVA